MKSVSRGLFTLLLAGIGVVLGAMPGQAQYYSYPRYAYPPPGYYPPPPAYYAPIPPPPAYSSAPRDLNRAYDPERDGPLGYPTQRGGAPAQGAPVLYGSTCYAGNYVCQGPPQPVGSQCTCPAIGAPSYGTIR